jgi:hypothetical protein
MVGGGVAGADDRDDAVELVAGLAGTTATVAVAAGLDLQQSQMAPQGELMPNRSFR